ncbi:hypothetical protein C922_02962 [Plasmodium inui San Antonio 1]|uniref:Uncharacterized protein n=1 Tax=Plasmodium inui San Antonio 1 TaxID=1237626 RepID=W7AMX0_9APIC|nr:hypothetical protein C922_02962 [Plasmodium inui San Antonio 1]EUD66641.1 hypothetical protein C922_02962 [Plasmodium inui San Antonio 1]
MGKQKDPIKVKIHSGRRVQNSSKLTKEQRVAHILLKEGIDYVENGKLETIRNDEYLRTMLFDYANQDRWEDDEERHLKLVRLHHSSSERATCRTNGESTSCKEVHLKRKEGNRTKVCIPPHKHNKGNQGEGKINGIAITPTVRTHNEMIFKRRFIDKRTISKMKKVSKKTPYGYHRRGKLPLKLEKRTISEMNRRGGGSGSPQNRSRHSFSNEPADGALMKTTWYSQCREKFIQVGRKSEDLKPSKRRTHFSPFQKGTIATHKEGPLPIGEMNNQFVKIHFNEFNSIGMAREDLLTSIGVDSLLTANTRKSFSCAHSVSTPFYGTGFLPCAELDHQGNCPDNAVTQGYGREGGESPLGERQTGGLLSRKNKIKEDFTSKEKERRKLSREPHRDGANHRDRPPCSNATPPKDGMCHKVDALFCRSRDRDLFNERNNEIMVKGQGEEHQRGRGASIREEVAMEGPNMDVSFDSDLKGVPIVVPDLKAHAFQAGTVLSKGNSGGRQHRRGARREQQMQGMEKKMQKGKQAEQMKQTEQTKQMKQTEQTKQMKQTEQTKQTTQLHVGEAGQTDRPNQEKSTDNVDKTKAKLDQLTDMENRRDMENAYVKYIYKRDQSEEAPAEKPDRYVTFGSEENDTVNIADISDKRKNTRRTYRDQISSGINLRHAQVERNIHGFGETLKYMKYRELLRKYMGTFYNYSSVKCATYIILYAIIVKIITQVSKNLTTSSGGLPSEKSNEYNVLWYSDSNLFLNVHDVDGIIQSVCYVALLICIVLLLKLGIPSNYLLVGRLTILFMFLFFAQIPIMIYANFMTLKKEQGIAKEQAKTFDKKDYFNLHMQRVYDVFYLDTLNLLVYTILLSFVSLYATYHKLIYPHLLKFYLDTIFLSSYTIIKKEVIQFRVPNNIDAYYLNQMNSYLFNSLYKKQEDLTQDDLESNTRSAIGYNIVIKKERCSWFMCLFGWNGSDSALNQEGRHGKGGANGRSAQRGRGAATRPNAPTDGSFRPTCGLRRPAQSNARTKLNLNFYIIFYIGELDEQGRPHGFGYWRGINLEGEVLIGYWFHGIPVGPFKCRDFKTGSGFMCIKIGYGRTNCEPNDLDIGLADTECCVSGAFYRTFPRVVLYDLNLTTPHFRSKKNDQGKHGIMEKRECCEYLHISRASNDILRVDYAKLLQHNEDDREGEADTVRKDIRPGEQQAFDRHSHLDENNYEGLSSSRIMGRIGRTGRRGIKATKGTKGTEGTDGTGERRFISPSSKEEHRKRSICRSTMTYDEILPSIVKNESFLKGELLNYHDICNLSYDFKDLTLDNETHSVVNKKLEASYDLAEEEEKKKKNDDDDEEEEAEEQWRVRQRAPDEPSAFPERYLPRDSPPVSPSSFSSSLFFPSCPSLPHSSSSHSSSDPSSSPTSSSSSPSSTPPCASFDAKEIPTLLDEGETHVTDVENPPRAEMGATKLSQGRHCGHRAGTPVDYVSQGRDHTRVHKKEKHRRRKKILPSGKMEKGRESKEEDAHTSEEEKLSRRWNNRAGNDSFRECELGKGDQKSSLELQAGGKKTRGGIHKREHKTMRLHMGDVGKRNKVGHIHVEKRKEVMNSVAPPVETGSPDAAKEGDAIREGGATKEADETKEGDSTKEADATKERDPSQPNGETNMKRKIKRRIGYSMTNTILHLRKFKHLNIKKKKKKKNIQTREKAKEKEKINEKERTQTHNKDKTKTNMKKRNSGGRKTFLPRALSGTLPKLKIKKKKKKIFFSDTITNVYKTKCMNIILQNLCPHMPNFGILYDTDLHISIDAERGLYITGYINKKNCNFIHDKTKKDEFEDNTEVRIKIIKRKNTLNYKEGTNRRVYSWTDNIKELSLDGWVKCELAGCLEAVIFIHGYNTSHLEALQILGQMASFGNFPNYIKLFLFNWPSGKNFLEFFVAKDNSKNKKVHHAFKCFLDTLRSNGIRHVHIITHSMGTRMFLLAFHDIVKSDLFSTVDEKETEQSNLTKMKLITLTMMNPEYYLSDFVNKEYVFLRSFCTVISIYCDSNDKALKWAEIFSGTKSLGKNVFDLNIWKGKYYKRSNEMGNYVFDRSQLDSFSIPIANKTNDSDDSFQEPKLVSSFFDCENFDVLNEKMRNKEMMTTLVQKLKKLFYFFSKKRNSADSNDLNEQTSIEHDQGKSNKDMAHHNFVHQPPMFRNTLLVFTGIEPTYSYRDNRYWLDVDVIDTTWLGSNVHTLRHSYWSLNREIIEDIRELIVTRKRARQRTSRLDRREGNVWVYRVAPSHLKSIFDSEI